MHRVTEGRSTCSKSRMRRKPVWTGCILKNKDCDQGFRVGAETLISFKLNCLVVGVCLCSSEHMLSGHAGLLAARDYYMVHVRYYTTACCNSRPTAPKFHLGQFYFLCSAPSKARERLSVADSAAPAAMMWQCHYSWPAPCLPSATSLSLADVGTKLFSIPVSESLIFARH